MKRWRQSQDDQMSEHEDKIKDGNEKNRRQYQFKRCIQKKNIYIYSIFLETAREKLGTGRTRTHNHWNTSPTR